MTWLKDPWKVTSTKSFTVSGMDLWSDTTILRVHSSYRQFRGTMQCTAARLYPGDCKGVMLQGE